MTRWAGVVRWGVAGLRLCPDTPRSAVTLQDLKVVNSYLKSCFLIFPNYNLGHGLMEMAYNEYINEYYAKIGEAAGLTARPLAGGPRRAPDLGASGCS